MTNAHVRPPQVVAVRAGNVHSEAPYPSPLIGWTAVGVLFLLYIVSMLDRNVMLLLMAPIKRDLRLTDFDISLIQGAAFSLCFVVAALPFGWAVDRFSRRGIICAGVFAWSLSTLASGLSETTGQLFLARSGVGLGEAALVPAAQSMLADLFPHNRLSLPMSIYGLGARVGTSLSLLLVSVLTVVLHPAHAYPMAGLGTLPGWKLIFMAVALPGLVLGAAIYLIPEPQRRRLAGGTTNEGRSYRDYGRFVARHLRFIVGHHVGYLTVLAVATAITTWTPAFLARKYGLSPFKVGTLFGAALLLAALVGLPIHGRIVDRLYARGMRDAPMRYMMWMTMAATPFGIAGFYLHDVRLAVATMGVFFLLCGCYVSLPPVAMQLVVPGEFRGKASAVILVVGGIASFGVAPSIVAGLTDFVFKNPARIGDSIALYVATALPIAAAMLYVSLGGMREMIAEQ